MEPNKLAIGILIILLVAGVAGISASAPDVSRAASHGSGELPQVAPAWEQVNSNGFGDPQTGEVSALAAFNGYIYAGTHNPIDPEPVFDGAQIFRSSDGVAWTPVTEPGFGISHDIAPPAILDLAVFNGKIYASTGRGDGPGQIYRSLVGVGDWAPMVIHGFSDPDNVDITALAEYNGVLYAGVTNLLTGAQIWRSFTGDSNSWTQVAPAVPGTDVASVTGFAIFDGALYAAVESDAPAQIWRSYGGDWTTVISDGFGDTDTTSTGGLAEFAGYLYVGAGNAVDGAQLWRTNDGDMWTQAITPGFGDPNNQKVELVFVYQNQLYASVKNVVTGMEVWRSTDGSLWEQANLDGFGDSNNSSSNWSNATADFLGHLYVGTSNVVDGGELWRMLQLYGVNLSPDDTLTGMAGQTLTYTLGITNTGSMTDSFDLTATGQTWTTTLSTSQVSLAPSASTVFSVTVTIPPGAVDQETDTVFITATSQGDSSKTDSVTLTSTSVSTPVYGVALSADDSLSGLAGWQVIYTLTLTNTGNVVDTFDLLASGIWTTTVSAQVVTLMAGGRQAVTITVSIPPGAADLETDTVTITATSQGDGSKNDTAVLTTVSTGPLARIYLPIVVLNLPP